MKPWPTKKLDYLILYRKAHNNAVDLLEDAKILFDKERFTRAYFLAFTALEEIAKSQQAADVFTGFSREEDFFKSFANHKDKIDRMAWAHDDANSYPNNLIWLGPDIDDTEKIASSEPLWKKRQDSLYVGINNTEISSPENKITQDDAREIIHIVETALHRIWEVIEYYGHQIGTKGFMK